MCEYVISDYGSGISRLLPLRVVKNIVCTEKAGIAKSPGFFAVWAMDSPAAEAIYPPFNAGTAGLGPPAVVPPYHFRAVIPAVIK